MDLTNSNDFPCVADTLKTFIGIMNSTYTSVMIDNDRHFHEGVCECLQLQKGRAVSILIGHIEV